MGRGKKNQNVLPGKTGWKLQEKKVKHVGLIASWAENE